jgi:FAD/FMN-containing dehydrogenase
MAFAAALCGCPLSATSRLNRFFNAHQQNSVPPDTQVLRKLTSQTVGQVITPEAADYDAARSIFNRAFDLRPAVIVRCGGASDVARALDFAQAQHLPLAVRAGGHSRLGFGMCDCGVVIDLSAMKRVEVDITKRVARAEAGALVRDLDTATQHFGLATTSGGCPTVGIAGFTLGGGEGRLMEKYGAACDNLLSARVVPWTGDRSRPARSLTQIFFGLFVGRRQLWCGYGAGVPTPSSRPGSVGSPHLSAWTHSRSPAGFRQVSCGGPG